MTIDAAAERLVESPASSGLAPEPPEGSDFVRLWAAFRDLAAISALRTLWRSRDPSAIADDVVGAALGVLHVDAAHVRFDLPAVGRSYEALAVLPSASLGDGVAESLAASEGPMPDDVWVERVALDPSRLRLRLSVVSSAIPVSPHVDRFLLRSLANEVIVALQERELLLNEQRARREAEAHATLMGNLQAATAQLAAPLTEEEIAAAFLEACARTLGAAAGVVESRDAGVRTLASFGGPDASPGRPAAPRSTVRARRADSARIRAHGRTVEVEFPAATRVAGRAHLTLAAELEPAQRDFLLALTNEVGHALRRARDRTALEASAAARHAFIGVVSHELRTPITTILGATELLDRLAPTDDRRGELLADVGAEADRLYRLVENLLVISKVERGALELTSEPVLLGRVVRDLLRMERRRFPDHAIELDIPPGLPPAIGDRTSIEQVLRNLLGNAVKYGGGGGPVEVRVNRSDGMLVVSVLDAGPGIDADDLEAIFDLFYRSPRTARATAGAGIGLYVCRALVEAMGGRLRAAVRGEGGSIFSFELPVYEDDGG